MMEDFFLKLKLPAVVNENIEVVANNVIITENENQIENIDLDENILDINK